MELKIKKTWLGSAMTLLLGVLCFFMGVLAFLLSQGVLTWIWGLLFCVLGIVFFYQAAKGFIKLDLIKKHEREKNEYQSQGIKS